MNSDLQAIRRCVIQCEDLLILNNCRSLQGLWTENLWRWCFSGPRLIVELLFCCPDDDQWDDIHAHTFQNSFHVLEVQRRSLASQVSVCKRSYRESQLIDSGFTAYSVHCRPAPCSCVTQEISAHTRAHTHTSCRRAQCSGRAHMKGSLLELTIEEQEEKKKKGSVLCCHCQLRPDSDTVDARLSVLCLSLIRTADGFKWNHNICIPISINARGWNKWFWK